MNKKFRLLSLVLILTLLVGGSFYSKLEAQEPEYGGKLVMTDGSFSDAKTLDPHKASAAGSMRYIENMYNTLLKYEKGSYGKISNDLVKLSRAVFIYFPFRSSRFGPPAIEWTIKSNSPSNSSVNFSNTSAKSASSVTSKIS